MYEFLTSDLPWVGIKLLIFTEKCDRGQPGNFRQPPFDKKIIVQLTERNDLPISDLELD